MPLIQKQLINNAAVTSSDPHNQKLALFFSRQVAFQKQPMTPSSQDSVLHAARIFTQSTNYGTSSSGSVFSFWSAVSISFINRTTYFQYQQPQHQQQQWPQQSPQLVQPLQPPSMHSKMRPPSVNAYTPYLTSQATSPPLTDTFPYSMPMQKAYSWTPQTERVPNEWRWQKNYSPKLSQFAQGGYPPQSASLQNPAPHNLTVRNPSELQLMRSHPYNELILW